MNRRFALPTAIACSAHAFLLFGFSKPAKPPLLAETAKREIPVAFPPLKEEPPEIVEPDVKPAEMMKTVERPRGIDEPPPAILKPGDIPVERHVLPRNERRGVTDWKIENYGLTTGGEGKEGMEIFNRAALDNKPRTKAQASPIYPHAMKVAGITGEVVVDFIVNEEGRVIDPRVVRSTHREFEEATLRAVSLWRFEPGRRHNVPVKFRMSAPVVFSLSE